jgi:Cu2+-containing amine oxidase
MYYELALQEAFAVYSGNDPVQAGTAYADSHWGMGTDAHELLQQYDCPFESALFNVTVFDLEARTIPNAICIFEQDLNIPLQAHYNEKFYSSTKTHALTIRSIASVYNYDYLFGLSYFSANSHRHNFSSRWNHQVPNFCNWIYARSCLGLESTKLWCSNFALLNGQFA